MALLEILLILFVFFEFHYFLRFVFKCILLQFTKSSRGVAEEGVVYGICLTTDLDFMLHMNNARYLREIDFGRVEFLVKNGIYMICRQLGGKMMQSACNIRYRRSITLFQIFRVRTKLLYWDERNFYYEHRMETISDGFIRAIALEKQTLVGVTPEQVLEHIRLRLALPTPERPSPPADLLRWIDSNELSSRRLQRDSAHLRHRLATNGEVVLPNVLDAACHRDGSTSPDESKSDTCRNGVVSDKIDGYRNGHSGNGHYENGSAGAGLLSSEIGSGIANGGIHRPSAHSIEDRKNI